MAKVNVKTKAKEKIKIEKSVVPAVESQEPTEKEKLLKLYKELQDRNIRSISDLENLIARAE